MALLDSGVRPKTSRGVPMPLWILLGLAVVCGGGWFLYSRVKPEPPKAPVLTQEARDYVRGGFLQLSDVQMSAKENFANQMLVEITGKIANTGNRSLKLVQVNTVFADPYGQPVYRERQTIAGPKTNGLKSGEIRNFRLAFDTLPESWNQALPQLVIAQIVFD